jgi:hypothetical protein
MTYTDYLRKKTKTAIDYEIYQKKIKKKTNNMEKFQDFILEESKFSNDSK